MIMAFMFSGIILCYGMLDHLIMYTVYNLLYHVSPPKKLTSIPQYTATRAVQFHGIIVIPWYCNKAI